MQSSVGITSFPCEILRQTVRTNWKPPRYTCVHLHRLRAFLLSRRAFISNAARITPRLLIHIYTSRFTSRIYIFYIYIDSLDQSSARSLHSQTSRALLSFAALKGSALYTSLSLNLLFFFSSPKLRLFSKARGFQGCVGRCAKLLSRDEQNNANSEK